MDVLLPELTPTIRLHRISLEQYHQMIEAQVFGEDDHVELLDGIIVSMSPHGVPHALSIQTSTRSLVRQLSDESLPGLRLA